MSLAKHSNVRTTVVTATLTDLSFQSDYIPPPTAVDYPSQPLLYSSANNQQPPDPLISSQVVPPSYDAALFPTVPVIAKVKAAIS